MLKSEVVGSETCPNCGWIAFWYLVRLGTLESNRRA